MYTFRIVDKSTAPFLAVYDFVFDRLRAVRQDLVVQGFIEGYTGENTVRTIKILESCVRFYIYCGYRLVKILIIICLKQLSILS